MYCPQLLGLLMATALAVHANPVQQVNDAQDAAAARDQPEARSPADMSGPEKAVVPNVMIWRHGHNAGCTNTVWAFPHFKFGPTRTIYTATVTSTSYIDCRPCTAVQRKMFPNGPGPAVFYRTTITAPTPWTRTAVACSGR